MPPGKDLLSCGDVLPYAGDVLERMKLSCCLQYAATPYGILKHHHRIIWGRNRHACPDGLESLQKYRGMGAGSLGLLGSNRKAVHGGAIKSRKAEGREYVLGQNPSLPP
jgi:hypothetical protein